MLEPQYTITEAPAANDIVFGLPSDFLRLDSEQESDTVEALLDAAVEWAEVHSGRVLRLTSFTAQFPCFDTVASSIRQYLEIRRSPIVDVTEVRVTETDQAATSTPFTVVRRPGFSQVFFPSGTSFELDPDVDYPIEVDFRAGYSHDAAAVFPEIAMPASVRVGIKQHVAFMFENRGDVGDDADEGVPDIVKRSYSRIKLLKSFM